MWKIAAPARDRDEIVAPTEEKSPDSFIFSGESRGTAKMI